MTTAMETIRTGDLEQLTAERVLTWAADTVQPRIGFVSEAAAGSKECGLHVALGHRGAEARS